MKKNELKLSQLCKDELEAEQKSALKGGYELIMCVCRSGCSAPMSFYFESPDDTYFSTAAIHENEHQG